MKKLLGLGALLLLLVVCVFVWHKYSWNEERCIDAFSEKLFAIIKDKRGNQYAELRPKPLDQYLDVKTGQPSAFPVKKIPQSDMPRFLSEFDTAVGNVNSRLGGLSDAELAEVSYLIHKDKWTDLYGLFWFNITMTIKRAGKKVRVEQSGCVLSTRGVLVGDCFTVLDDDMK